jgi:uncharacterized Ntn-hydrolase superfamily protein
MKVWILAGGICLSLFGAAFSGAAASAATTPGLQPAPQIATFSIVARDPVTGDYGVAVQSRYFAVGAVVPHAAADTGAVATQARGNLLYGPQGLALLERGLDAEQVIRQLLAADPLRDERQVGVVDSRGRAASHTGEQCLSWAGGRTGPGYAVQGNLLAGPQVVDAMATAYEAAPGDFATRLVYALAAGQAAGGDARGRQSAALLVVRKDGGYLGLTDRYIDLHVEDHVTPIRELFRLLRIRQAQLASEAARQRVAAAATATDGRAALLAEARGLMLDALDKHPADDYGWWLLARIHLMQDEPAAAALAAQRALLENPAWRHLSAANREGLGVSAEFLDALLEIDSFRRVWNSLAAAEETASP